MNTILARTLKVEKESEYQELHINDLVKSSSKVIAPLGPISTFAARHPWVGMEHQPFEQVARRLKDTSDVDIYPNESLIKFAWESGEINQDFLELELKNWLDSQSLEMPRKDAEQFCRNALMLDKRSSEQLAIPELKNLARKLSRFKSGITEKHLVQTYSQRLEQMDGEEIAKELNGYINQVVQVVFR